tara:strand:+ start:214 stop:504 length:291 start_codon:yes stop_codon:yes gene_type:complete
MTELQKRAKEYLISKGVKKTGDKFIALEVMDLLCEFVQREQLTLTDVSTTRLLTELRKHYLVDIDFDSGLPKADLKTVMKLWDEVNKKLNIKTVGS